MAKLGRCRSKAMLLQHVNTLPQIARQISVRVINPEQATKRHLVLRGDLVAGELLNSFLCTVYSLARSDVGLMWKCMDEDVHITKSNHADCLPDTKTDSRSDTAVQALETVVGVDVPCCRGNVQVLGTVGVDSLGLQLNADNLDGLVPRAQTTTEGRSGDLLDDAQLLAALLASHPSDTGLSNTGQTKAGTPVGDLGDSDGVDTTVDAAETLGAPDVHECLHGAWGLEARSCDLVLCDLDGLHAGAETHGRVGLRETTSHAARNARNKVVGAKRLGVVLGLGGDEEENGALGGGFDPGPRDEALVDCSRGGVSAPTRAAAAACRYSQPLTPPRPQTRLMAPVMPSDLLAAMVVLTTSKGCARGNVSCCRLRGACAPALGS